MKKNNSDKKIRQYLNAKYQSEFSFVSKGDDVWSSKTNILIFKDCLNNEFMVKENNGYLIDNYYSIIFDKSIQEKFQKILGENYKVFVSSEAVFFGASRQFNDCNDYIKQCPVINMVIYSIDSAEYEKISESLLFAEKDITLSVVVYTTNKDCYAKISDYSDTLEQSEILSSESFWIEENQITSSSWEE